MAAHACLKNEITVDEKYHNLMTWHDMARLLLLDCPDEQADLCLLRIHMWFYGFCCAALSHPVNYVLH